jgi:hypothetical protein
MGRRQPSRIEKVPKTPGPFFCRAFAIRVPFTSVALKTHAREAFDPARHEALAYFTFDLLHLDGHDLRACPIEDRKDREPGGRRTNDALE